MSAKRLIEAMTYNNDHPDNEFVAAVKKKFGMSVSLLASKKEEFMDFRCKDDQQAQELVDFATSGEWTYGAKATGNKVKVYWQ